MKKWIACIFILGLALTALAGCAKEPASGETGAVYYLNFKPEQDAAWQNLANQYTAETGIPVTVFTAASGTYEQQLMAEMGKSEAPTLFQVNGPVGLANWKEYCYDLSQSKVYGELTSQDFALKEGESVLGIAYAVESYGLIYNKELLAQAGYEQADITDFASLKAVCEDITQRSDELGFAAFTSAGMESTSDWRFKTHLANLPIYYEFENEGMHTDAIHGSYLDNYRAIWDLYLNNATCEPYELSAKTGADAVAEFTSGQAVFYQNGTWAYQDVSVLGDDNLGMLPIYIGAEGEQAQGLCTGSENYWCVNRDARPEDIQATLDFLYWVVTSDAGTAALAEEMGFVSPFRAAKPANNPLVQIAADLLAAGKTPVDWYFTTIPSEEWKNGVGSALTAYAADPSDDSWEQVRIAFVDGWAREYQASHQN